MLKRNHPIHVGATHLAFYFSLKGSLSARLVHILFVYLSYFVSVHVCKCSQFTLLTARYAPVAFVGLLSAIILLPLLAAFSATNPMRLAPLLQAPDWRPIAGVALVIRLLAIIFLAEQNPLKNESCTRTLIQRPVYKHSTLCARAVHVGLLFLSSAKNWRELYALSCMAAVGIAYGA